MVKPSTGRTEKEKTERYDLRLKEILHTSARLFAEKGFHNASVRDISRETGVSLAGLYYYFQTKEELLFLILEDAFDSVLGNLEASIQDYQGPDKIRFFVANHLRYFVENLSEMKVVSHEFDSLASPYREKIQEKKRAYVKRLTQILSDLPNQRRKPVTDPKLAALALFGMINWVYTWYNPRKRRPINEVVEAMSEIFLHGYLRS